MRRNTAQEREGQISRLCEGTIYSFAGWVEEYRNNNSKFICICEQHDSLKRCFMTSLNLPGLWGSTVQQNGCDGQQNYNTG